MTVGAVVQASQFTVAWCNCSPTVPVWNDTLYGRDAQTAATSWRSHELDALVQRYRIIGTRSVRTGVGTTVYIRVVRSASETCSDHFFAQLRGNHIQNVDFSLASQGATCCVYSAMLQISSAGVFSMHVWLTYLGGSGETQPTILKHALRPYEDALRRGNGRLKTFASYEALLNRSVATQLFMYQFAGVPLPDSPWTLTSVNAGSHFPLQPLCNEYHQGHGSWWSLNSCLLDVSCRMQGSDAFYGEWVWKPFACRLRYFAKFEDFEQALRDIAKSRKPMSPPRPLRMVMAGESLMREDFCMIKHFSEGLPWSDVNCYKYNGSSIPSFGGKSISFEWLSVPYGFYETAYGYNVTQKTTSVIQNVIKKARHADAMLWSDVGHSLEKNEENDYVALMTRVAKTFRDSLPHMRIAWRPHTYIHTLGPAGFHTEGGFYRWSYFLQGPRVLRANSRVRAELESCGLRVAYDPSHLHRSRPDLTRDRMHSAPVSAKKYAQVATKQLCREYCDGRWASFMHFVNLAPPVLPYYTMQLTLNSLLQL